MMPQKTGGGRPRFLRLRGEQAYRLRQPPQRVIPAIIEAEICAGDEVAHGGGDENAAALSQFRDARRDVHGHAADLAALDLDLAGMESGSHGDPNRTHPIDDRRGAADGTGWAIEGREKAIAKSLNLAPAVTREFLTDSLIVPIEQTAPLAIPDLDCTPSRIDDIGEQYGGQNAVRLQRFVRKTRTAEPSSRSLFEQRPILRRTPRTEGSVCGKRVDVRIAPYGFRQRCLCFAEIALQSERCSEQKVNQPVSGVGSPGPPQQLNRRVRLVQQEPTEPQRLVIPPKLRVAGTQPYGHLGFRDGRSGLARVQQRQRKLDMGE
jgi:hypothetical protein